MRQKAREITDRAVLCAMLDGMDTLFLGIHDEPAPYVVPLNFGYAYGENLTFYFHCAQEGYKLELLAKTLLEKETMDGRDVEALVKGTEEKPEA